MSEFERETEIERQAKSEDSRDELGPTQHEIESGMQHLCACLIDIGGDHLQIVARELEDRPVTWAEIKVLQEIHGEDSVFDIRPVALVPRSTPQREKQRMALTYGDVVVERVYAGRGFTMEFFMPGWPLDPAKAPKKKPERPRAAQFRRPPDAEAADFRG